MRNILILLFVFVVLNTARIGGLYWNTKPVSHSFWNFKYSFDLLESTLQVFEAVRLKFWQYA